DHLDRHPTLDDYRDAKSRIFDSSDLKITVLGVDEPPMQNIYKELQCKGIDVIPVSVQRPLEKGIYVEDGYLVDQYWGEGHILKLSECAFLKGSHNAQNMAACYALARYFGIASSMIVEALKTFQSLPHRCEWVATIEHIQLINDSKATNVDSACKALSSYDNIYWIVGGQYKNDPLEPLDAFLPKIRKIYTIGSSESVFIEHFQSKIALESCKTLEQAFESSLRDARASAESSVVLLSPACASFDQFKHFEHRGDRFKELAAKTFETLGFQHKVRTSA
ncbi:MAG: Mur ligase family protein, partial [Candidatus Nucleicultricaceae bacterium]